MHCQDSTSLQNSVTTDMKEWNVYLETKSEAEDNLQIANVLVFRLINCPLNCIFSNYAINSKIYIYCARKFHGKFVL